MFIYLFLGGNDIRVYSIGQKFLKLNVFKNLKDIVLFLEIPTTKVSHYSSCTQVNEIWGSS